MPTGAASCRASASIPCHYLSVGATRVAVIGQGYVGLPLAMAAVSAGYHVVGYDIDKRRVDSLTAGQSYVEDVTDEELASALATGRYEPTEETRACAGFDIAVITVPTPLREGAPDLSYIEGACHTLGRFVRPGCTVILESTTYPGTTDEVVCPLLEEGSGLVAGTDFHVGFSPERIDPGNPTWGLRNTPKIVSGIDAASRTAIESFYGSFVDQLVPVASPREAEMAKLIENTFRHVNIALVNELAMVAEELGVDVWEAIDAAATKPFGFMRFTPGPGVGGHCLPIDPSYLGWRVRRRLGQPFRFVELANDINEHMPDYVVRRLVIALNRRGMPVNGRRILLLGLAYKKNTGDAREAPSSAIIDRLLALGAEVRAADPHVVEEHVDPRVIRVQATAEELVQADAVVLVTDHDLFDYDLIVSHAPYVLDTRHRISGSSVEQL